MLAFDLVLAAQDKFVPGGGYISTSKVIPVLLIVLGWARMLTWTNHDAPAAHLPRTTLNIANLCGMVVAFALFFVLPSAFLAFLVLIIVLAAEGGVYLGLRNKAVGLADLGKQFKEWRSSSKSEGAKTEEVAGSIVILGKDGKPLPVPESGAPDRTSYDAVQRALTDPILRGAQQIDIAPEGDATLCKYIVDNVSHNGISLDRVVGAAAISYMKWAAGLNIEDRRKPQAANLKITVDKVKHELKIQTAGTTAGEYLRIIVDPKVRHAFKLPDLGFNETQLKQVEELIKSKTGLVLLSAPKGHGLTSLFYSVLRSHDAFLEHAQTIEHDQEQDIEGITQNKLPPNAAAGEEFKMVDWIISQEPNVIGVSKVEDPKSANALIAYARDGKRAYICLRAGSTFEALEQWKRVVGDSKTAAETLRMVINGRVLRKLCSACKEGFTPDPATLKKLNLSADKVTTLYKAREQPLKDSRGRAVKCEFCHDLRYKGLVGVYETLIVDDELRKMLDANKPLNQAFRKQRGRYMQEEALALVEKGETSVQEVLRILKPAPEGAAAAARPAATAAPRTGTTARK